MNAARTGPRGELSGRQQNNARGQRRLAQFAVESGKGQAGPLGQFEIGGIVNGELICGGHVLIPGGNKAENVLHGSLSEFSDLILSPAGSVQSTPRSRTLRLKEAETPTFLRDPPATSLLTAIRGSL